MHPAFSILVFTTLAGAGQGLVVAVALALLAGVPMSQPFVSVAIVVAELLLVGGLASSFLHLGHKMRAWRSVLMWRTSWMSREVIALPAFIVLLAAWWFALRAGAASPWPAVLAVLVVLGALVLWYCTAMIYACLRFIEEWAHPLTIVNYILVGLSSGAVLAVTLAAFAGQGAFVAAATPAALLVTIVAGVMRWLALRRNATLRHKSTLQSATGIKSARLVQRSMGMTGGSFNTREFFHGASQSFVRTVRWTSPLFAFVVPALLLAAALVAQSVVPLVLAALSQAAGVLADRWLFFAQAKHPQNLYYQVVS